MAVPAKDLGSVWGLCKDYQSLQSEAVERALDAEEQKRHPWGLLQPREHLSHPFHSARYVLV